MSKKDVTLKINGFITDRFGNTHVCGFCDGFFGAVVINLSEFKDETDYAKIFNKKCCNGRKNHIIK